MQHGLCCSTNAFRRAGSHAGSRQGMAEVSARMSNGSIIQLAETCSTSPWPLLASVHLQPPPTLDWLCKCIHFYSHARKTSSCRMPAGQHWILHQICCLSSASSRVSNAPIKRAISGEGGQQCRPGSGWDHPGRTLERAGHLLGHHRRCRLRLQLVPTRLGTARGPDPSRLPGGMHLSPQWAHTAWRPPDEAAQHILVSEHMPTSIEDKGPAVMLMVRCAVQGTSHGQLTA